MMRKITSFFKSLSEPISLPYSSVRIAVVTYLGLLILGAVAYVCLVTRSGLVQYFEQLGYRYDLYTFIADVLTYAFSAWLAYQVCDTLARIYTRALGNMLVEAPRESQVVWYLATCIFCLSMLLTIQFGWLYFCLVPLVAILLPGIVLRTFTREKKLGLALSMIVVSQVVPLVISRFVNTVFAVLVLITITCLVCGFLCLAVEKRATAMAMFGVGLGAAYYTYLYVTYSKSSTSQAVATFIESVVKPKLFLIGFTPLTQQAVNMACTFQGPIFPFVLLLFLAVAAIPEELLCRSVIPRVGLYLATLMFLSLHIPSRLAGIVMPFGSIMMPVVAGLLVTTIFLIGLGALFILLAYRYCGLVGSITLHAFYDTLVTLYYMNAWIDIAIANIVLLAGLIGYAITMKIVKE